MGIPYRPIETTQPTLEAVTRRPWMHKMEGAQSLNLYHLEKSCTPNRKTHCRYSIMVKTLGICLLQQLILTNKGANIKTGWGGAQTEQAKTVRVYYKASLCSVLEISDSLMGLINQ